MRKAGSSHIAASATDVGRDRRGAFGSVLVSGQVYDFALRQPGEHPVQEEIEPLVKATWMAFQQCVKLVFTLRRSEKLPMIDNVELGTLADTHWTPMRPDRDLQRLEGGKYTHQLFLPTYLVYAGTARSIDRTRRTADVCKSGYAEQTMAETVSCREPDERISRFALGRENPEGFSHPRDAAIGKRHDIYTRSGIR